MKILNKDFEEIFSNFEKSAKIQNCEILEKKFSIASKEMFSLWVSECLIEDINTVRYLKNNKFKRRYIDSIIRNMCEQTIEYIYIMEHQELIEIYFGKNLNDEDHTLEDYSFFTILSETGEARYNNGKRKKVREMARSINELKSSDEKIALYDIFRYKAELEHNSYFHHVLDVIGEMNDANEEIKSDEYCDELFMITIITTFSKAQSFLLHKGNCDLGETVK